MTETITLYTVVFSCYQLCPELVSDTYEVKPKSFMRSPSKYDGMPNRLNKQDYESKLCPVKPTAVEAWDFYVNEQIEEKSRHQKKVDDTQRRLDWAFAQHRKAELGAR